MASETELQENQVLLSLIRRRYEEGIGAAEENRRLHSQDLRFCFDSETNAQWDPEVLALRQGRPSYTFNRVLQPVNMVLGDQRQTRPAVKVRPSSDGATQEVADIFGGLFRSIEEASRAEAIYDEQFKQAVGGGFGELRILPEFLPGSFDQVLRIKNIPNPLTVVRDPECTDPCGADAMWCMVGDRISREKYKTLYPVGDESTFDMSRDSQGWFTDKEVRVVEYFERVSKEKTIALLDDGRVIDWDTAARKVDEHLKATNPEGEFPRMVKTRKVLQWKVMWVKVDGSTVLEGPIEYDWLRIPVIRIPGRYINIEGKQKLQSLIRHSKDSQRAYNFRVSDTIERSGLTSKAPYMVTPKMIVGLEGMWANANSVPRPYLLYNVDKDAPEIKPTREPPIDMPAGSMALAQQDAENIQATTGAFNPSLGNANDMNRVSGVALVQHTSRGDLASHEFIDNYGKALQLLAECAIDMIPTVYDTERVERIVHPDGSDENVTVNQQGPAGDIINSLKNGKYDSTVTIGPSYQTARQETLQTLLDAAKVVPQINQVGGDLLVSKIDDPIASELAKRLRKPLIAQGIIDPTPEEKKNMAPPPPPDPMHVAEVKRAQALADKDSADAVIAQRKAGSSEFDQAERIADLVNMHLKNILAAQQAHAGTPAGMAAAVKADAQAEATTVS